MGVVGGNLDDVDGSPGKTSREWPFAAAVLLTQPRMARALPQATVMAAALALMAARDTNRQLLYNLLEPRFIENYILKVKWLHGLTLSYSQRFSALLGRQRLL